MRAGRAVVGAVLLLFGIGFLAVGITATGVNASYTAVGSAVCGVPLLIVGLVFLLIGLLTNPPAPPRPVYYVQQPVYYPTYQAPAQPQVIQQKEVVTREIVKVRCRYCGTLVDEGVGTCPRCQAPMR